MLNPKICLFVGWHGFKKWYAFHRTRLRKISVLSVKNFKYSLGGAIGMFLVEYPRLTGSIFIRTGLNSEGAK